MKKLLVVIIIPFLLNTCSFMERKSPTLSENKSKTDTLMVDFWSGNRSAIRQDYEREVLEAILKATEPGFGSWQIMETETEYPGNEEAQVFREKNHDVFVTIAGNQKFSEEDMIVIPQHIAKNLLGYRIAIIRAKDENRLAAALQRSEVKKLLHGIPETWSDATIFRHNGYSVSEEGDFDDIFERLVAGNFDYSTFGANEVMGVFQNRASKEKGLMMEKKMLFFYPFPLVFYVNPKKEALAKRLAQGLHQIAEQGGLDAIFGKYYQTLMDDLNLDQRQMFVLENPLIPEDFSGLKPDLDQFRGDE